MKTKQLYCIYFKNEERSKFVPHWIFLKKHHAEQFLEKFKATKGFNHFLYDIQPIEIIMDPDNSSEQPIKLPSISHKRKEIEEKLARLGLIVDRINQG